AARTEHAALFASLLIEAFGNAKRCQILFYAQSHPGLSIGGLSSLLDCSVSVVSQYVSQLERQGWLQVLSVGRRRLVRVAGAERARIIGAMREMSADLLAADGAAGD
ncbi:winged helix-turn-helix transcriptional regulator, partial [Pseudomonas sp. CGJS7]|uniref:winged helix-turn-helix transcriptional regulator n=1 Tax=Pseudomonas sp. CGJS7 TaxID=3109348 RepID=UPI00300BF73B